MKKIYVLLFTILMTATSFGQGLEDFANSSATGSYGDGSFVGNNNITWTYVQSRDDAGTAAVVSPPALMLRRVSSGSKVTSSTITGGIGDFSVKLYKGFTGAGNRQVELFINGISKGTSTVFDDFNEHIFSVTGINQPGDIVIEIVDTTSKQVIIDDITWTGFTGAATPSLSITSPADNAVFSGGTTSVDVSVAVGNFVVANPGSGDGHIHWTVNGGGTMMKYDTNTEAVVVSDGNSYTVYMELVDDSHAPIVPAVNATVNFSVAFPCDLIVGGANTTCDAVTAGIDTYTTTIDFTGGGSSTYTIDTGGVGTVDLTGGDPSVDATGTITVTGVNEGVDFSINILGDVADSSCNITRGVTAPTCVASTCAAVGSVIITEVMQNPSANGDPNGEYFELFNTTGAPIVLDGWIIKDDFSVTETHTITSLTIPASGYVVIGNVLTTVPALDYNYGNDISLGNSTDGLILECSSTIIDTVVWDNGATFPDPSGASMELATNAYDSVSNDTGSNWGTATSDIGNGDLGTPGVVNDFVLSVGINEITGFAVYPNPITDGYVSIRSANQVAKSVKVFNVLGKQVINTTVNNNERVNVANLNAGIYILKVEEEGKVATRKLVIQ